MIDTFSKKPDSWEITFDRLLPMWGHGNWIVIADSAYPAQCNPGIQTIPTGTDHLEVLNQALYAIDSSKHIKARIYLNSEFKHVSDQDAPGVTIYRPKLVRLIGGRDTRIVCHDDIISRLDQSGKLLRVLILKSNSTIPYTSVFFELDCKYWNWGVKERLGNEKVQVSVK